MSEQKIQRWNDYGTADPHGHWVRHSDHLASRAADAEKIRTLEKNINEDHMTMLALDAMMRSMYRDERQRAYMLDDIGLASITEPRFRDVIKRELSSRAVLSHTPKEPTQ